jgi:hypothetical protein
MAEPCQINLLNELTAGCAEAVVRDELSLLNKRGTTE